jgi:hypothetical protein
MTRITGAVLLAACGLFVVYAEGLELHWFVLWNLFPLLLSGLAFARGTSRGRLSWAAVAFTGITTTAIALVHAAWVFDWGSTQTTSSTAGLIFLFSPILALVLGGCGWGAVKIAQRLLSKRDSASCP